MWAPLLDADTSILTVVKIEPTDSLCIIGRIPIFTLVRSFLEDFQESVLCPPLLGQEAQRITSKVRPATIRTLRNCSPTKKNPVQPRRECRMVQRLDLPYHISIARNHHPMCRARRVFLACVAQRVL